MRYIARGLSPIVARSITDGALKSPWVLQPVFSSFSALSPTWLFIVMTIGFLAVGGATVLASRGRFLLVRRVPAWRSATPAARGPYSYNAFAYANPIRHVLGNILGTRKAAAAIPGRPPAAPPITGTETDGPDELEAGPGPRESRQLVTARVAEPVESYLYQPLLAGYLAVVRAAKKLQSGRLGAYVGYMLAVLIVVLVVAAALG